MSDVPSTGAGATGETDPERDLPDGPLPVLGLPQPEVSEGKARRHIPSGDGPFLNHRALALELRYYIDMGYLNWVEYLLKRHPAWTSSKHVLHNLGENRLNWLKEKGLYAQEP